MGRSARSLAAAIVVVASSVLAVPVTTAPAGGAAAVGSSPSSSASVACGDTITTDTTLHRDLLDCPGSGIVIGADDITLDLNGHTIDGDAEVGCAEGELCDLGVDNTAGHDGVVIEHGSIRDFAFGLFVAEADDAVISRLAVSDSTFIGVLVILSERTQIVHSSISGNGLRTDQAGLAVFALRDGRIAHNSIEENGDIGVFAGEAEHNAIEDNALTGNPEAGMILEGGGNTISRNRVARNGDGIVVFGPGNRIIHNSISAADGCEDGCGSGISLEGGDDNVIAGNILRGAARDGIRIAAFDPQTPTAGTVVRDNHVRDAGVDGLSVGIEGDGAVTGTLVEGNTAISSGDDGFDVRSPASVLTSNLAVRNADLGIAAVVGVTDGGGNRAAANGDASQCSGVTCR